MDGKAHPVTELTVVLTVAHLDHTLENVDDENLTAIVPTMPRRL